MLNGWVLGWGGVGKHPGMAAMLSWNAALGSQVCWVIAALPEGTPDVSRCNDSGFLSAFYLLVKQETVLVQNVINEQVAASLNHHVISLQVQ